MKRFKHIYGQQLFSVSILLYVYIIIIGTFMSLLLGQPIKDDMKYIFMSIFLVMVFFGFLFLVIYLFSKKKAKVYAECYDEYMYIYDKKIYYQDVTKIILEPIKWLPQALGKSIPYAPNYLDIYYNNTYVLLERVSLFFIMYIKRKCFKAKLKIKHLFIIFIGIPIILVLIDLFIVLIAQLGR